MTSKVSMLVRATGIEDPGPVSDAGRQRLNPEVPERARRRRFTAKYKLEILAAYDASPASRQVIWPHRSSRMLVPVSGLQAGEVTSIL